MIVNTAIKLAYHTQTAKVIHIDHAENGRACQCECMKCNEKLIAVQGDIRVKHFRHDKNPDCDGSQETALHQLGIQILVENNQIAIPIIGLIDYSNAIEEKKFYATRPDVTAIYREQSLYFEIAVNHFMEPDKDLFFTTGHHKCVEIDLSAADTFSYEKIKNSVLIETSNKKLLGWEQVQISPPPIHNWIGKIAIGTLFLLIVDWVFNRPRR